jgi:hypothetical protein
MLIPNRNISPMRSNRQINKIRQCKGEICNLPIQQQQNGLEDITVRIKFLLRIRDREKRMTNL